MFFYLLQFLLDFCQASLLSVKNIVRL